MRRHGQISFTPLEKVADFNRRFSSFKAGGGLKSPAAPAVREPLSSLTGFTLIELLVALAIFSVIAVSLYSTFASGVSVWRKSESANRLYQEGRVALERMARELRSAVPFDTGQAYPQLRVFDGKENSLAFFLGGDSGIQRIGYYLEPVEETRIHRTMVVYQKQLPQSVQAHYNETAGRLRALMRWQGPLSSDLPTDSEYSDGHTMSASVKDGGLAFRYAYQDISQGAQGSVIWKDTWQDAHDLPRGIKITLTLMNPHNPTEVVSLSKTVFIPTGILGEQAGQL